jgi:hypothetical protein
VCVCVNALRGGARVTPEVNAAAAAGSMAVAGRFLDWTGLETRPSASTTHALATSRPGTRSLGTLPRQFQIAEHRAKAKHGTMSSNKKSSLTGYLPDILMAAAAVRPFLATRHILPTPPAPLTLLPSAF